jgi:hypothetical protein
VRSRRPWERLASRHVHRADHWRRSKGPWTFMTIRSPCVRLERSISLRTTSGWMVDTGWRGLTPRSGRFPCGSRVITHGRTT